MRLNMTQQGGLVDEFVSGGGNVLNPLILIGNPTSPLEAATKQYVDASLMSLNVNNVIGGTISGNRFPAMNGDLVSSSGSANLVLSNTGVTPGTYAKVSVDNKGRVTNGMALIESEIPGFSWNKITSDKPTTLGGYGITDALPVNGGTMTGQLSVSGTPTLSNQLANKGYLDGVVGGSTGIAVGDIITKVDSTTPTGFLKCNGAELEKTAYADLYTAIGDRYVLNGKAGNGQPWRNQYDINTENFGDLSNWRAIPSLPGVLGGSVTFVTKNRVYVFGGFNGSSHVGTGYTAQINNDGTLGPWSATTALPGVYAYSASIVTKNKVYLLGGYINNTTATNITYVADINADGTIGTWGNGPTMPGATSYAQAFINKNKLYVIGGYSGSALSIVYSNNIKEDGSLDTWVTETSIPSAVWNSSLVCIKDRVYIFGGFNSSSVGTSTIYSGSLNNDGSIGSWVNYGNLPITTSNHQVVVTRNFVYIVGGNQNGSASSGIYKANILADGSIGSWQLQPWSLPATAVHTSIAITKDHIHVIGGMLAGGWSAVCWTADITGGLNDYSSFYSNQVEQNYMVAGSGKPWQQQYQFNTEQSGDIITWSTATSLPTATSLSQIIVTNSKVHILGGFNGTNFQSTTYSASINTDGTLGDWVVGSPLPSAFGRAKSIVTKNRVYLIAGNNDSSYITSVYTAVINTDGTLGTWSLYNSIPGPLSETCVAVTNNRVYLFGGFNGTYTNVSTVYTAAINVDGTLGSWTTGTSLPVGISYSQTIITKNRVYLLGGLSSGTAVATVYTTTINSDGTLGIWTTSSALPGGLYHSQAIVTKNSVYLLGGTTNGSNAVSTVYRTTINSDGILGAWTTGTSLPGNLSGSQAFITNNHIYLITGFNGTSPTSSVYMATISGGTNDYSNYYAEDTTNYCYPGSGLPWQHQYQINITQSADITGWGTTTPLPGALTESVLLATKNRVYMIGGWNGSAYVSTVYTALINGDGTLDTWTTATALPGPFGYSQCITTKNRIYLLGGYNGSAYVGTVYTAQINSDGTLGTWVAGTSVPTAVGQGVTFVTKNRAYLVGGWNGNAPTSTIYTAAINNDGTLGGWVSATSYPVTISGGNCIITKNRIYICGGYIGSAWSSAVYTASISPDGTLGSWSSSSPLPGAIGNSSIFVTKNKAYIFGGTNGGNVATVYTAPINADGTLGTWVVGTSLSTAARFAHTLVTKNKIYLVGGYNNANSATSTVHMATIASDTQDYSSYFNGDILPIEQFVTVAKFKLPDASFSNDSLNYFIKY